MRGLNLFSLFGIKRSADVYWVRYCPSAREGQWPSSCTGRANVGTGKARGFLEKVLDPSLQTFFNKLSFRKLFFRGRGRKNTAVGKEILGELSNNWTENGTVLRSATVTATDNRP